MSNLSASAVSRSRPSVLIALCVALIALMLAFLWAYLSSDDQMAMVWVNRDFANYWIASRLVLDGQVNDLFSGQETYFAHMQAAFGPAYPWHNWSYPPHYLLLVWPLGTMPFGVSAAVFLAASLVLFCHAACCFDKRLNGSAAILLLPFCIANIFYSQNGFLIAALTLYGLAFRRRHPVLAGIAFGLLTVKPQMGLLIPFLLIAERRFATIAATCLTVFALFILTILLWGIEPWRGYIDQNLPYQREVMMFFEGAFLHMMPTLFGALRVLGMEASVALNIHIAFALCAFAIFIVSLRVLKSDSDRAVSLLLAGFLVSPYSLVYDMGALAAAAAILFAEAPARPGRTVGARLSVVLLVCLPALTILPAAFDAPIAPLIIAAAWAFFLLGADRMTLDRA